MAISFHSIFRMSIREVGRWELSMLPELFVELWTFLKPHLLNGDEPDEELKRYFFDALCPKYAITEHEIRFDGYGVYGESVVKI